MASATTMPRAIELVSRMPSAGPVTAGWLQLPPGETGGPARPPAPFHLDAGWTRLGVLVGVGRHQVREVAVGGHTGQTEGNVDRLAEHIVKAQLGGADLAGQDLTRGNRHRVIEHGQAAILVFFEPG